MTKHSIRKEHLSKEVEASKDAPKLDRRLKRIVLYSALGLCGICIGIWMLFHMNKQMILVEGGVFMMGCTSEQKDCEDNEKPVHKVELSSFYMGTTEVSFAEYDTYCESTGKNKPHDYGWGRENRPVIDVSWYDAVEYCNWLSKEEGLEPCYSIDKEHKDPNNEKEFDTLKWTVSCDFEKNGYRLPTEAEWEYAARGGNKSKGYRYSGTSVEEELYMYGNFCDSSCVLTNEETIQNDGYAYTAPVGMYKPNELGLYDMSGNVWEWCWDWYAYDTYVIDQSLGRTPRGSTSGAVRVVRGAAAFEHAIHLRVSMRSMLLPTYQGYFCGFRLVRTFH